MNSLGRVGVWMNYSIAQASRHGSWRGSCVSYVAAIAWQTNNVAKGRPTGTTNNNTKPIWPRRHKQTNGTILCVCTMFYIATGDLEHPQVTEGYV